MTGMTAHQLGHLEGGAMGEHYQMPDGHFFYFCGLCVEGQFEQVPVGKVGFMSMTQVFNHIRHTHSDATYLKLVSLKFSIMFIYLRFIFVKRRRTVFAASVKILPKLFHNFKCE